MHSLAIIGSGPTAIYTAQQLLAAAEEPLSITMFEAKEQAGKGMPYHENWTSPAMLANIASLELPPVTESLVAWLERQPDAVLEQLGVERNEIDARTFFPRIVLGEYFHDQLNRLVANARAAGHRLLVCTSSPVDDVLLNEDDICIVYHCQDNHRRHARFKTVVLATGHVWPEQTEIRPGYFLSPWPVSALETIGHCHVGIRGTSLSGIDAAVALSCARGSFATDETGCLCYLPNDGTEGFRMTMISRKGLLPEADFYHPIPYEPLAICTAVAVEKLITSGCPDLLDKTFVLFKQELAASAPDYAATIGLDNLALEGFCEAYFEARQKEDPFAWAEQNLAEAIRNQAREYTIPSRYAILRMHEVVALIAPHLTGDDHGRFSTHFKPVFVDDYATVPHESIERILALHRAGKLNIISTGTEYELDTECSEGGARLVLNDDKLHFPAFIEAMGQRTLSANEFPFPSLRRQGVVTNRKAYDQEHHISKKIGGIALDESFRPLSSIPQAQHLYCLSLPFMLGQFPFAQGITSSYDMGKIVAKEILAQQITENIDFVGYTAGNSVVLHKDIA